MNTGKAGLTEQEEENNLFVFKNKIFVLVVSVFPLLAQAQKTGDDAFPKRVYPVDLRKTVSSFDCGKLENTDTSSVRKYLLSHIPNLRGENFSVEYFEFRESKKGLHYLYRQNYLDNPVYRGTVKINFDKSGNILSIFDNTYRISEKPEGQFPSADKAYHVIKALYPDESELLKVKVELLYFDIGTKLIPASRIELWDVHGNFFETIIDETATVVYERDLNNYYNYRITSNADTPAVARIFNPDPLTTAGVSYGTPYEDAADADVSQLNMQRQQVTIDVSFQDDTFKLENSYCKINEHSLPEVEPVTSLTPDFEFTRAQDGFEDVNTYYHINVYHDYVVQLGFNNIVDYPIWVDTHGMGGADNSNFNSAGSPPRLSFGEGGVDDAEDADVIIHEYGHAISYSAAPNTNSGTERMAIDEGLGDYFAASYSKAINDYNWENMFSWDGHNEFWSGRVVVSNKHYPESLLNQIYKDAEIWSSTLMQITDNIGREVTDEILIESLFSYSEQMTMSDAACLLIQADDVLNDGEFAIPLSGWLTQRGFTICNVGIAEGSFSGNYKILNSLGFAMNNSDAVIQFNSPQSGTLEITDATGRIISAEKFLSAFEVLIHPKNFGSGIYLTKVTTQNFSGSYKLVKW